MYCLMGTNQGESKEAARRIPFPSTVLEFQRWFPDEEACAEYLLGIPVKTAGHSGGKLPLFNSSRYRFHSDTKVAGLGQVL